MSHTRQKCLPPPYYVRSLRSFTHFVHSLRSLAPIPPRTLLQDCREAGFPDPALVYQGDTAYLTANDFDGIKLDNCGEFTNLTLWSDLINKTGKPQLIENCHWYVGKEIVEHTHTSDLLCGTCRTSPPNTFCTHTPNAHLNHHLNNTLHTLYPPFTVHILHHRYHRYHRYHSPQGADPPVVRQGDRRPLVSLQPVPHLRRRLRRVALRPPQPLQHDSIPGHGRKVSLGIAS